MLFFQTVLIEFKRFQRIFVNTGAVLQKIFSSGKLKNKGGRK